MLSILFRYNVIEDSLTLRIFAEEETVLEMPLIHNHFSVVAPEGNISRENLVKMKKAIENYLEKTETEE